MVAHEFLQGCSPIMVNVQLPPSQLKIRARPIETADVPDDVNILARGYERDRKPAFWDRMLSRLAAHSVPPGFPQYGQLLEANGRIVGALLQIYSEPPAHGAPGVRCNVSSWYVDPDFRSYATLLVSHAIRHKNVTYLNISPAPHTRQIALAQGYQRYSDGVFLALPALSRSQPDIIGARIVDAGAVPDVAFDPMERDLLLEHAGYGCISFWCVTPERAHPFVFRRRRIKRFLPCAQLIYCPDIDELVRHAGLIGRHLLRHAGPLMVMDANGPIPGLVGRYFDDTMPKYFKGPQPPRFGDLAYTEVALFGV
jgi:hypothetical protein